MGLMVFDENVPTSNYPARIGTIFHDHAGFLKAELRGRHLNVVLIPAPRPQHATHMIRAVDNTNPQWYRELYAEQRVRRPYVLASLERITTGRDLPSGLRTHRGRSRYDGLVRAVIYDQNMNGIPEDTPAGVRVHPADPEIVDMLAHYFNDGPAFEKAHHPATPGFGYVSGDD